MNKNKIVTCTVCPKGCQIDVEIKENEISSIRNYGCKRGIEYAQNEITDPRRVLTTTVKLSNGWVLPVKTKAPIPKDLLMKAMLELKEVIVIPPVGIGYVVKENIAGTGIDVVSTANIGMKESAIRTAII